MSLFEPGEVFQFAIKIEENGEKYYTEMARKFEDAEVKAMFTALASEEVKHRKTYEGMLSRIDSYEPIETYPGEYLAYLRAYADNVIFTPKKLSIEMQKIDDVASALKFAIDRELDAILYYQELRNLISPKQRVLIDSIIEEERRHFLKLTQCAGNKEASQCVKKD